MTQPAYTCKNPYQIENITIYQTRRRIKLDNRQDQAGKQALVMRSKKSNRTEH
jgi:hypothetical protein